MGRFCRRIMRGRVYPRPMPNLGRRRGASAAFDPVLSLGDKLRGMVWAPWEGGNHPEHVAARAQNIGATDGSVLTTLSNWSTFTAHFVNQFGTGVTWREDQMNGKPAFVCASQSYSQADTPALGDNTTIVFVYKSTGGTGYLYQGQNNSSPQMLARNTGTIEWYDQAGNATRSLPVGTSHVITRYISDTKTHSRFDGAEVDAESSVHDYGTDYIGRWLSSKTGSTRLSGDLMGWFVLQDVTQAELSELEVWAGGQAGIAVVAGFSITTPTTRNIYQRQTATTGNMLGEGLYDPAIVSSMEARFNGGSWVACTLSGGSWSVIVPGNVGRGSFEIRANGGALAGSVANVAIGRKIGGKGQSNIKGSSQFKTDLSSNFDIAIYDPRPAPMALMAGRTTRDSWGPAYDEGWIPTALETRQARDGVPWGMVRFAIGSTRLEWWEPTAPTDAAGLGYSVQYFDEFIRACIVADGRDPATYNPATDGLVVEEVHIQIGEADARFGTSKAAFKASLSAIAAEIKARLGAAVIVRISVLQDLFTTGYVDTLAKLEAIQDAVTETIAEDANVSAGPDFSDVVLDTAPPETNGNVHFYTDAQVALAASRWSAYPLAA